MGFKGSQVLHQMELTADQDPGFTLSMELSSAIAILEDSLPPFDSDEITPPQKSAELHQADSYQVALVSVQKPDQSSETPGAFSEVKPAIVLPLTWKELVVRLRGGAEPGGVARKNGVVRFGEVLADFYSMEVTRSDKLVPLTTMEFKLLKFLAQNAGRVVSREELLNEVWGYDQYPCTRTVDNHILKLRQKLELRPDNPVHFHTVRGVGYKFVLEASYT